MYLQEMIELIFKKIATPNYISSVNRAEENFKMGKIKVLSEEVANRIAAGEVIERPASVVKELVENSIDSKPSRIIVTIEEGGKKLIQVSDNGIGMSEDDALNCFERHATSKIRTVTDIFEISTLGFRGEALPSIASVSRLTLVTRSKDSTIAHKVEFDGGRLLDFSATSANQGTSITVRKLFTNVPARKKFLKSTPVEFKHILNYIHYQSILHPHIHFKLISNGKEKLNYPAVKDNEKRLLDVFGNDFLKRDLIKIESRKNFAHIEGYINGLEEDSSGISDFRYLFVNGRFIKDKIVMHSIKQAYDPFIKKLRVFHNGKTPPFLLFLWLDPKQVDFNVHPAKLEIRFRDPGIVHSFVKQTLYDALLKYEEKKFNIVKSKLNAELLTSKTSDLENRIFRNRTEEKKRFSDVQKVLADVYQPDLFKQKTENDKVLENKIMDERVVRKPDIHITPEEDIINPWQLHNSYIFVQVDEGLMVIDQHAAHERILYEKILHRIHGAPAPTQKLLFPIVIDLPQYLSSTIPDLISENLDVLHKIGFSVKTFSGNSIVIDEIPAELEDWDGGEVFIDIMGQLGQEFEETEDFRDSIAKSVSCKAAIKAGEKMGKKQMLKLINDLFACDVPYFCPHGRPLIIKLPLNFFEKKFKRIEN